MSHRIAAVYFLVQALAVVVWWATLFFVPSAWPHFSLHDAPRAALSAFALGDLGIVAVGSALVAVRHERQWSGPLAWIVAGAMAYGAAYTVTATAVGAASPLGALLMLPAAAASLLAAFTLTRQEDTSAVPTRANP